MDDIRYSVKEHSAGLDTRYEWTTGRYLNRHYTGRLQGLREVQVVRTQTGEAQSKGLVKDGNHLGGAEVAARDRSEWSQECSPMHPLG